MITGYIYNLSYDDELLYIGSTGDVDKRIRLHKYSLKNNNTIYFYEYLRENDLNFDDLRLVIINFDCNNNQERYSYEYELIRKLKPKCNIRDGRCSDMKEYQKERRKTPQYKEYKKEYQKTPQHKEYQKEYQKTPQYKEYQKEYQKEYNNSPQRKEYMKEYNNSPQRKEYMKEYYQKQKNEKL